MHEHESDSTKPEQPPQLHPKADFACLSAYNNSRLHGAWIDLNRDPSDVQSDIDQMLANSPEPGADECAVHDYEGFGPIRISEYESLDRLTDLAQRIEKYGPAFAAWVHHCEPEDLGDFAESYAGDWNSRTDYVEDLVDHLGITDLIDAHLTGPLQNYVRVDIEALARDLELAGEITVVEHEHGVWIFRP